MSFMYPNFVTASTTTIVSGHQELVSDQNTNHSGELSGEEAKSFYEYIVYGDENSVSERDGHKNSQVNYQCSSDTRLSNSTHSNGRKSTIPEEKSDIVGKVFRYAQEGNLKALKKALRGNGSFDINVKDKFLWTPLMCGAHAGHKLVVKFLLEKGAVWQNNYDQKGNSAIDLARLGGHSDVEMFLLENEKVNGMCTPNNSQCKVISNEKYWCTLCQIECTEDKRKHEASTVHLFNSQQKSHKTVYSIPEHSIGYQMMVSSGWNAEKGLGRDGSGRKFPVKTILKRDRLGLGCDRKTQPRITHFGPKDHLAVKSSKVTKPQRSIKKISKQQLQAKARKERNWEQNIRRYMSTP